MLRWAIQATKSHPARAFLSVFGVVLTIAGLAQDRTEVTLAGLLLGVSCVLVGTTLPRLRELVVNLRGGEIRLRTKEEVEATAEVADASAKEPLGTQGLVEDAERRRADARHLVATAAVDSLLHPSDGALEGCQFRLFMFFADRQRLLPVLDPDRDPQRSEGWEPGQGVTGEAWRRADYVVARGPACSDASLGLSASQQERYQELQVVAGMPVLNVAGSVIAVLSASSNDGASRLDTPEGFEEHLALAAAMARILIDLLRWADDE